METIWPLSTEVIAQSDFLRLGGSHKCFFANDCNFLLAEIRDDSVRGLVGVKIEAQVDFLGLICK